MPQPPPSPARRPSPRRSRCATAFALILSSTLWASCTAPADEEGTGGSADAGLASGGRPARVELAAQDLKMHPVRDPDNGMVQAVSPIPEGWQVAEVPTSPVRITGPDGVRVFWPESSSYFWSDDPFMRQTITQSGQPLAPVPSLQEVLQQHVRPAAETEGYRFVDSYPLPEVEGFWQRFFAAMPQTGTRRQVRTLGTEWTDGQGTSAFIAIGQTLRLAGSKYYWVGKDGSYFGTDNPLYDPRTDRRVNDLDWTKFVQER